VNPQTAASRIIRQRILTLLCNTFAANPDVGVLAEHVYALFADGRVPYGPHAINAELVDLLDDGLIEVYNAPTLGHLPSKAYKPTSKGRDFARAGCPWDRIDEYTGGERLA